MYRNFRPFLHFANGGLIDYLSNPQTNGYT
jgi:hypothetical protein